MKSLTGHQIKGSGTFSSPGRSSPSSVSSPYSTPSELPSSSNAESTKKMPSSTESNARSSIPSSLRSSWRGSNYTGKRNSIDLGRYPPLVFGSSHSQYHRIGNRQSVNSVSSGQASDDVPLLTSAGSSSPFGGYPLSDFVLRIDEKESDDYLHNPDPISDATEGRRCNPLDRRGWGCITAFVLLVGGCVAVFVILPLIEYTGGASSSKPEKVQADVFQLSPYRYGVLGSLRTAYSLIDPDTPEDARTHKSMGGEDWLLVFSDEFSTDGRTFYPGEDPVWEAVDIHYQATTDLEWYDPDAAYTLNGALNIRLDAFPNHDLFYRSAMVQSWNKFCFTQGYIEVGARLPGNGTIPGLWPGIWTMGNLARAGYLASSDGVWPYGYSECDAGITPNQSSPDGLNFLPGQRLNQCTCNGEEHPSPGIGRGAPEIDVIEGTVSTPSKHAAVGTASQSLQVAPMDIWYTVDYDFIEIYNHTVTKMNTWTGGPLQQAVSAATYLNEEWYQVSNHRSFQRYGFEYLNSRENGYITWYVGENPTYTMYSAALTPNGNVGWRDISQEPMSIIMNLGISQSWTYIDWIDIRFPALLEIDYVRVYQPASQTSLTCDPDDFPMSDYIENHMEAYKNANATTWEEAGYHRPRNRIMDGC